MKLEVFDIKGKKIEDIEVSSRVFGVKPNITAVAQYIRAYLSNQRQGTSSTKNRGEVSGGGKKPWKQKGTGRARAGSTRGPIWRHGGVSHGPKPKSWYLNIPKKIKRLALFSALSSKYSDNKIKVLESLKLEKPKTKEVVQIIDALGLNDKLLIVFDHKDERNFKSTRNISGVTTALVDNLNAFEIMKSRNVLFLKEGIKILESKYETE